MNSDGVAELVGSFFGRIEFKVYGFGDINKKTTKKRDDFVVIDSFAGVMGLDSKVHES